MCYFSTLALIVAEAASISLCTLSLCFPLIAFSEFPSNADILPFSSLYQFSCFKSFVSGLKIACPDLSLPWSSSSDNSASIDVH